MKKGGKDLIPESFIYLFPTIDHCRRKQLMMSPSDNSESEDTENSNGSESGNRRENDGARAMLDAGMGNSKSIKDVETMMVKRTVSKNSLLYCPFVNNARELAYNRPFAKITLGFLGKNNLSEEDKTAFWEEYKHTAHKALNVKRSNIAGQIRKIFVGKSNYEKNGNHD